MQVPWSGQCWTAGTAGSCTCSSWCTGTGSSAPASAQRYSPSPSSYRPGDSATSTNTGQTIDRESRIEKWPSLRSYSRLGDFARSTNNRSDQRKGLKIDKLSSLLSSRPVDLATSTNNRSEHRQGIRIEKWPSLLSPPGQWTYQRQQVPVAGRTTEEKKSCNLVYWCSESGSWAQGFCSLSSLCLCWPWWWPWRHQSMARHGRSSSNISLLWRPSNVFFWYKLGELYQKFTLLRSFHFCHWVVKNKRRYLPPRKLDKS